MENKVCMVTGVGEGNGRSISQRFAREGFRVAMLARSKDRLDQFEQEISGTKGFVCDVTSEASMRETVQQVRQELGPIDTFTQRRQRHVWRFPKRYGQGHGRCLAYQYDWLAGSGPGCG